MSSLDNSNNDNSKDNDNSNTPNDDALMAPIPRKKRPSIPAAASTATSVPTTHTNPPESSNLSLETTIPRKHSKLKRAPSLSSSSAKKEVSSSQEDDRPKRNKLVRVSSQSPLVLRIKINLEEFSLEQQQQQQQRTSQRQPKRTRPLYKDADLTDSDDFMTDDEHQQDKEPPLKRGRLVPYRALEESAGDEMVPEEHAPVLLSPENMAPPEGTLSTLWYSREVFGQVFVLEKVLGFKTRPLVRLLKTKSTVTPKSIDTPAVVAEGVTPLKKEPVGDEALKPAGDEPRKEENVGDEPPKPVGDEPPTVKQETPPKDPPSGPEPYILDPATALHLQQTLLQNEGFWPQVQLRMEISRLLPHQCPAVMVAAAVREQARAKQEGRPPEFYLAPTDETEAEGTKQEEEVLLVKWRGRSYLHCSWERAVDVYRSDTSNNSTSRNKVKRYYQSQELALGLNWKNTIKLRATEDQENVDVTEEEEYFPVQYLELERIMACDENEMDMDVLAKQRGRNMSMEQEALQRREEAGGNSPIHESLHFHTHHSSSIPEAYEPLHKLLKEHPTVAQALLKNVGEIPWDEEDNVRYVVKYKTLPYSEITWEYWRDIKLDAVNLAEDYWHRQKPPDNVADKKSQPHMRDFKKLQESPLFGISGRSRPCIGFEEDNDQDEDEFKGFKLRSYQLEGVNWLIFNWWNQRSCILADEMGLGKTIQSAAYLRELQTNDCTQIRGPFLIVAPLSLAGQWQSELNSWAPDMNVILYHGSADARDFLVQNEFYYKEPFVNKSTAAKFRKQHVTKFHVLITTYEVVLKDSTVLSKIRWKTLIVDEAHRLKNHKSRLFDELAAVPRDHCVLLTGTPIANATEELWALLHFANPTIFNDRDDFLSKFGEMTDAQQVNDLHSLLRPYLLRRVKEDVEKSLPPKEETILEVSLTPIQKTFYKAIYERNTTFLFKGAKANNAPSLMNVMMELRKVCNHPFLIKGAEERILTDAATKQKEKEEESAAPVDYYKLFAEQLVKASGKMVLIEKLLQKLFTGGHKVLIFSQMVKVLDLLEELLKLKRYRYERLDGSTSSSSRAASVERFTRKSCQRFVMLLSTRAGGLGLNLTTADTVIIFDSDWNPQNDLQAMARAHRIGQEKRVMIYRLLTQKTYEMHMFHSASLKLGLERAVLSQNREQSSDSDDKSKKKRSDAQAKEIDQLLKKGAYDVFRDDDNGEAEKFMEADIDQLLADSSKKVTYGASSTSSLGSGLGSFSKASFVADTDDGAKDVDLDDPDFWSKAVGLEVPVETPEEIAAMIDDGVKRNRKQVQVFDPYADTAEAEQRKKDKIAMEKQLEKEEKDRQRLEKRAKKEAEKDKKKKDREDQQKSKEHSTKDDISKLLKVPMPMPTLKKTQPEPRPPKKKSKKNDRQRALRRFENENPAIEQLKQAWDISQRNRASAAVIRFGNLRFCKLRHESNLTSLPLQDLEIFTRSYLFQIAFQVGVALLEYIKEGGNERDVRLMIQEWLGAACCPNELEFMFDAIAAVMRCYQEVENYRRFLRMPVILAEPIYVTDLRRGAGFRALRRVGTLTRLNHFIEEILDDILSNLGHEELGKRGSSGDIASLDVDLKARFVTVEELALAIGTNFRNLCGRTPPAIWWDRECDTQLILGTFIHGLGNYKSMGSDSDLCFLRKSKAMSSTYSSCGAAMKNFSVASRAARKVFDDALEAGRVKAELEVQAAVAAAAKAAKERERDAAVLREGGEGAETQVKHTPDTLVEKAFEFDGTDSHFVTLERMQKCVKGSVTSQESHAVATADGTTDSKGLVPMPDARVLDYRLLLLLGEIEQTPQIDQNGVVGESKWTKSDDVLAQMEVRNQVYTSIVGESICQWIDEFSGVGLGSYQCGTTHRSLMDGSCFSHGSATSQLAQVAYGTDAPRYLRQIGVPMNLTRYAVCALAQVDSTSVDELLKNEKLKFYGNESGKQEKTETKESNTPSEEPKESTADVASNTNALPTTEPASKEKSYDTERLSRIPKEFRDSAKLRALVCMAVLMYGHPSKTVQGDIHPDLLSLCGSDVSLPRKLFDRKAFHQAVTSLSQNLTIPEESVLSTYIDRFLIPHCLQLCLYGNGPTTRDARGSQGEYETAMGISLHPEPGQPHPLPIPDPCAPLQEHSLEAVCHASAILRRVQLLRATQYIGSCRECSVASIQALTKSRPMRELQELPAYWCPWLHDIALVIHASTNGLFSVIPSRKNHPIFSSEQVEKFLRSSLSSAGTSLPGSSQSSAAKIEDWIIKEAEKFPVVNQIERRLSFFCDLATAKAADSADRYCNLPMFDTGGWPRI